MKPREFNERGQKIIRSACEREDGSLAGTKSAEELRSLRDAGLKPHKAHNIISFRRKNGADIQQAP